VACNRIFRDLGKEIDLLVDCLRAARTWLQCFNILDQTFLKALRPATVQPELGWAWRRLAQTHGCGAVHQLAREIGWSRQHFGERFQRVLGVPPKTWRESFGSSELFASLTSRLTRAAFQKSNWQGALFKSIHDWIEAVVA
jgi:hypothetical protein